MMYRIINGLVAILNHHHSCICRYSTIQQNNCTQSPSFHPQSGYGTNYQKPQQQPWTWNPSKRKSRQSDSNTADLVFNCIVSPLRKHGCFKLSVKMLLLQPCTLMEEEEEKIYRIFCSHGTLWCMIQSKTKKSFTYVCWKCVSHAFQRDDCQCKVKFRPYLLWIFAFFHLLALTF